MPAKMSEKINTQLKNQFESFRDIRDVNISGCDIDERKKQQLNFPKIIRG